MGRKGLKITYWVATILFVLFMLFGGISSLIGTEAGDAVMVALGYPLYLNIILGIAKTLGSVALIQNKFMVIKEWAYAGFAFDIIGAGLSFIFAGFGLMELIVPVITLAVMFVSYATWKKLH